MKKKYLELYHKWLEQGHIDRNHIGNFNGMCNLFKYDPYFQLLIPTREEKDKWKTPYAYWAAECNFSLFAESEEFGPTRQNIVLLMAAMNGEL